MKLHSCYICVCSAHLHALFLLCAAFKAYVCYHLVHIGWLAACRRLPIWAVRVCCLAFTFEKGHCLSLVARTRVSYKAIPSHLGC